MTKTKERDLGIKKVVNQALKDFQSKQEELIPILMQINQEIGFIPNDAIELISSHLHLPKSKIYSVASFYHMISTKPTGRHIIKFCESAPCHIAGGREV